MRHLPIKRYAEITRYLISNYIHQAEGIIYPFYASFKITNKCRFRCKFCNVWRETTPILDTEGVKKVLDNLARSSIFLCSFEGGEPLLREDIGEILEYRYKKPYYLLFTTSERDLSSYPMKEYCKYIDFLHISIDEGHKNLYMFDSLEDFISWGSIVCVQTVVTNSDIPELEWKVERCYGAGAKIVIMPAVHLDGTKNFFPEFNKFKQLVLYLKRKYPLTIITPDHFFDAVEKDKCATSSIIIDTNGDLFYPCRTLNEKSVNLTEMDLKHAGWSFTTPTIT